MITTKKVIEIDGIKAEVVYHQALGVDTNTFVIHFPDVKEILSTRQGLRRARLAINSEINLSFADSQVSKSYLEIANQQLSKDITAALRLGSLDFIGYDLEWIEQLTKRSNFDRRVFQDGIYIVNKDGKQIA